MSDDEDTVDWDRYLGAKSRAADGLGRGFTALGDPVLWGGSDILRFDVAGSKTTKSIVHAQCADNYARNWQIIGTLTMRPDLFTEIDPFIWQALLQVSMGVGQTTIEHTLVLRSLIDVAFSIPVYSASPLGDRVVFPFVVTGGLVGQRITARQTHFYSDPAPPVGGDAIDCQMLLAPVAAGSGL